MAEPEGVAERLADDLWVLDTVFQGERGVIASYMLVGSDGLALVDVGSAASLDMLLAGIHAAGFDARDVSHLLLTHVHLDHAGASGPLVRLLPRARIFVHSIGAPHLIDPTKLVSSAERIYGERMQGLWGHMEPVPADRITVVNDGDTVDVGARTLRVLYTPGHAIHHVAYFDAERREVFAGDVAGVHLQGVDFVRPPTPPPDLNLEDWSGSIDRLESLRPNVLYLPHFGPERDPLTHLRQLRQHLREWGELMLAGIRAGKTDTELAADLARASDPEVKRTAHIDRDMAVRRYELATNYLMSAQGYVRYYRKHHPELLA